MDDGSFWDEQLHKVIIKSNSNKPDFAQIHICLGLHEKSVFMPQWYEGQEGSNMHVEANGGMLRTLVRLRSDADVLQLVILI